MLFQHTAGHPRVETGPNLYHFNISTLLHHIPYAAPAAVNNTGRFGGGRMESDQMKTKTKSPWYNHIEEWILAICFGLMTAIVGVNVVLRAFNHSLSWADQAARILFVWCTLIGISLGAFTGQHLKVEAIDNFLPRKITYWIDLFGDFVSFVYAVVVSYMMWVYIQNIIQFPQYFSSMPWLSAAVMYIPGLIGMIGFCIRIMQASLVPNLKLLRGKAYLTNTIKGPIPQEELDKHNKKKSKKKGEDQ